MTGIVLLILLVAVALTFRQQIEDVVLRFMSKVGPKVAYTTFACMMLFLVLYFKHLQ